MRGIWALVFATGCQEYNINAPPDTLELPALPPTIPVELPITPPVEEPGVAEADVYANTRNILFDVDPFTGGRAVIGTFHFGNGQNLTDGMTDIAIDNDGRMYGGTEDALYRINAQTAEVTLLCNTPPSMMYAMAFTPAGELIASGQDGTIRVIDVMNCGTEVVVNDPIYDTSGDLVGHPDGFLYWTVDGEDRDTDGLVRVDPNNWYLQYLGEIPFNGLYGLGYANDELFGFSSDGETVTIQTPGAPPANGMISATAVETDDNIGWWGATTNPVAWSE